VQFLHKRTNTTRPTRCRAGRVVVSAPGLVVCGMTACTPADRKDDFESFPIGGPTTVYDVHTGVVGSGDRVRLDGVVAVLPRTPDDDRLMVQAPEGGEYAGLELHLHHALPGLTVLPGDRLSVQGLVTSRSGRLRLIVDEPDGIRVTGSTRLTATIVRDLADWEPYNAVLVAPGPTELTDCGEVAGQVQTDQDFRLDLTYAPDVGVLGMGLLDDQLQGVIGGVDHAWALWPRSQLELGTTVPEEGCPTTIAEARARDHEGRLALPGVVVTGIRSDGHIAFVQDADDIAGLEVHATDHLLAGLEVGQSVDLVGLLAPPDGPRVLQARVVHPGPADERTSLFPHNPADLFDPSLDGTLVDAGRLRVSDEGIAGRRSTDAGIELVDLLLEDETLPADGEWNLTGLLRVDDRTDPPGVQLLPRSEADWKTLP